MPPILVHEDPDGVLEITDGVTRATRIAKLTPGETLGELCADLHGRGLWDASDAELLEAVWQFRRDFEAAMITPTGREA